MSSEGLKRLKVCGEAKDLAVAVYHEILPALPSEEKWSLGSQIRRSVTSIPANIAEGYGRYYYLSIYSFCYNARGSLDETISHIVFAVEAGLIQPIIAEPVIKKADTLAMLINGYIAYLRKSKQGESSTLNRR
jgi:four helix bundle protein